MIKKFKNFDADKFINDKQVLKESASGEGELMKEPKINPDFPKEDVIGGKAVYEDPYLLKIANIVSRKLNDIGNFGIYHDIVYLDEVPGVWFYSLDDDSKNIVCCRNTNIKTLAIFKSFNPDGKNKAEVIYSTEKFGFTDMIEQMIEDLKDKKPEMNEGLLLEAGGFGDGYSEANIANFKRLAWVDKQMLYDLASRKKKADSVLELVAKLNGKDRDVLRILTTFSPRGEATKGGARYIIGLVNDIMNNRYPGTNKDFDDLVTEYESRYKGTGPAISATYGTEVEAEDMEAAEKARIEAIEAARKAEKEKRAKEYYDALEGMSDMADAMCHYVKNNGELNDDDASIMTRRGMLITGFGGIGKTYNVKQALKKNNMVENKDYLWISLDQTTSDALYTMMYDYNGKLIVFDDAPKLFEGDYRIALWKNALQTEIEDSKIGYPKGDSKLNVYNVRRLKGDRQRRYYVEIGHKSDEDRAEFIKKEMKRRGLEIAPSTIGANIVGVKGITHVRSKDGATDAECQVMMTEIEDMWKEEQENTRPSMPNTFIFNGVIIIISNETRERFIASMGRGNWDAISTRFENYDITPDAESIWSVIKTTILDEYNNKSLADRLCLIPRDMTYEFIEEVEGILAENPDSYLNWRTIAANSKRLRGKPGLKVWKKKLRDEMFGTTDN